MNNRSSMRICRCLISSFQFSVRFFLFVFLQPGASVPLEKCHECVCTHKVDSQTELNKVSCMPVTCNTQCPLVSKPNEVHLLRMSYSWKTRSTCVWLKTIIYIYRHMIVWALWNADRLSNKNLFVLCSSGIWIRARSRRLLWTMCAVQLCGYIWQHESNAQGELLMYDLSQKSNRLLN